MKGQVALVTGVGRRNGIGAAVCIELAKAGTDVFYTYWHQFDAENYPEAAQEDPDDLTKTLQEYGVRTASIELDLSEPSSAKMLFDLVKSELGSPDILINNAAFSTQQSLKDVTAELLDRHYAVNLRAPLLLCREFVLQGKPGRIVNLTSGQSIDVMEGELPYTVTKAGLEMLTKQLASELKNQRILINAFDPGPTDTGWMDDEMKEEIKKSSGKVIMPEDAAKGILALLTQDTTGKVIHFRR